MQKLIDKVAELYEADAIHIKRGFRVRTEGSLMVASNHLIEEAVELQAELLFGDRPKQVEEAGDLLTLFCHILKRGDITLAEVVDSAYEKACRNYTTDPTKVTAHTPGVTRSGRTETTKDAFDKDNILSSIGGFSRIQSGPNETVCDQCGETDFFGEMGWEPMYVGMDNKIYCQSCARRCARHLLDLVRKIQHIRDSLEPAS